MPLNEIIATAARKGAEINPCHGKMCNDCAFKIGTDANNEEHTVCVAMDCLVGSGVKFHCHRAENGDLVDAGRPCAGFLYAKIYYDKMDRELEVIDTASLPSEGGFLVV